MQNKLKNCPFCNGKPVIHKCAELENEMAAVIYNGKVGIHCKNCGVATLPFDNENKAVEVWNRRCS